LFCLLGDERPFCCGQWLRRFPLSVHANDFDFFLKKGTGRIALREKTGGGGAPKRRYRGRKVGSSRLAIQRSLRPATALNLEQLPKTISAALSAAACAASADKRCPPGTR
jgi:hypothetical protein